MRLVYFLFSGIALLSVPSLSVAAGGDAAGAQGSLVAVTVNHDEGGRYSLYQDYQDKRNHYLAEGGVMLHEEYATHHFALKVKRGGIVHYCGAVVNGNQWAEAEADREREDDPFWRNQMRELAAKVGLKDAEMAADGM